MKSAKPFKSMIVVPVIIFFLCCAQGPTFAGKVISHRQAEAQHQSEAMKRERHIQIGRSKLTIPDVMLVNHRNQKVRLYEDAIKNRIVLLSFFYTTCQYVCVMQGESLAKLQARLKDRVGKDVFLISITTDPETDNPQKLKEWAAIYGGGAGWTLLTGEKSEIHKVLHKFTGDSPGRTELHSSLVYIGNDANQRWIAINGLSNTEKLVDAIEEVSRNRTR